MKTIKNLRVKVTYTVGYGNIEVPDDVYKQLFDNSEFSSNDSENGEALEWLGDNLKEEDAIDWNYDVYDME